MIIFNQITLEGVVFGLVLASIAFGILVLIYLNQSKKTGDTPLDVSPLRLLESFEGMAYACNIDEQWTMTYVNSNAYKILGYSSEEVTNNHVIAYNDIIHPKYRDYVRNQFLEAIENHEDVVIDYMIVTKDNQEKWVREEAQIIYDSKGNPTKIEGYIYDIEENKNLLYDKNIYEFKYKSLFEGLEIPLIVMTKDQFIDVNQSALKLFKADSKRQFLSSRPLDLVDPSFHDFFHTRIKRILETKSANMMAEYKLLCFDQTELMAVVDAKPYFNQGELYLNVMITETGDVISKNQKLRRIERINRDLILFMKEGLGVFQVINEEKDGKLIFANQKFSELIMGQYQNLVYRRLKDIFRFLTDDDYEKLFNADTSFQKTIYDDLTDRYIQTYFYFNDDGELIVQVSNITKEKKLLAQYQEEKDTLDEILEATGTMIWSWDRSKTLLHFDQRAYDLLGYDPKDSDISNPRRILRYIHKDDRKRLLNQLKAYIEKEIPFLSVEVRIQDDWGQNRWWMIRGKGLSFNNDVPTIISGTIQDVTNHKEKDEEIRFLSLHDQLTKLYNLRAFDDFMVSLDKEENYPISMALVDVNGLKVFNDALNHRVGDELLIKTANTLKAYAEKKDIVARVGGDEFVMIMPNTPVHVAEERFKTIDQDLKGQSVSNIPISISYGLEEKFNDRFSMYQIKDMADSKMYKKKFSGKDTRLSILEQIKNQFFKSNQFEQRVVDLTHDLSMKLAKEIGLDLETLSIVDIASQYYNIGIFSIRQDVINDDRYFKDYEEIEYRKHVENGYRIMLATYRNERIALAILHHHEKVNGKGYPSQLKSKHIPITSRIISICATYARRLLLKQDQKDIFAYIREESGISFDPELVKTFINLIERTHEN